MVQRGSNHPWLIFVMTLVEQSIRIGLAVLLLKQLQIYALIIAYFAGILVKVKPQKPGRYLFFDDLHQEANGTLVVE